MYTLTERKSGSPISCEVRSLITGNVVRSASVIPRIVQGTKHIVQCESKKSPLGFSDIFPKRLGIFSQTFILTARSNLRCASNLHFVHRRKFLSNYLQFWRSYAVFSPTTQFTPYVQNVHHICQKIRWHFLTFPPNSWDFTHLLHVPILR